MSKPSYVPVRRYGPSQRALRPKPQPGSRTRLLW